MKPKFEQIIDSTEKLGFEVFRAPYSVNLGAIRTNENTANTFNDWLFCYYFDDKGNLHGEILPGTVDAGLYYRLKPMHNHGTAIIVDNMQHRSCYMLQDPQKNPEHLGHRGQKAFRQIKPMLYWRDNNKNDQRDRGGKTYLQNGATNGHYMGKNINGAVNKWSAGCWGSTEENMNKIFRIAEVQKTRVYSFTLLHETALF